MTCNYDLNTDSHSQQQDILISHMHAYVHEQLVNPYNCQFNSLLSGGLLLQNPHYQGHSNPQQIERPRSTGALAMTVTRVCMTLYTASCLWIDVPATGCNKQQQSNDEN